MGPWTAVCSVPYLREHLWGEYIYLERLLLTCWPGTEQMGLGTPGHVLPGPKPFQGQVFLQNVSSPVALAFLSALPFLCLEEKLSGPSERQLRTLGLGSVPQAQGGEEMGVPAGSLALQELLASCEEELLPLLHEGDKEMARFWGPQSLGETSF